MNKTIFNEIKGIKSRVQAILSMSEKAREDDNYLIALFYHFEVKDINISLVEFLAYYSKGKYSSPESIRRCRQKLQEQFPELRGGNYKNRQNEGVSFTQNIGEI